MTRRLVPLAVPAGPAALTVLPQLRAALDGSGPAVLPHAAGSPPPQPRPYAEDSLPDDLAVVVGTSGSTGEPKLAMLTASALAASAAATAERLGGHGDWLLALPAHHIAGLQVLLRAAAGSGRVEVLPEGPFTAGAFATGAAVPGAAGGRRYVSLVPTQLARVLTDREALAAARGFDAILVGGAATAPDVLTQARGAGLAVVTTYGSSETCGGCVYDGDPLPGVRVLLADDGRITLAGPMVAAGYLGDPARTAATFGEGDGLRCYRTDDLGAWEPDPTSGQERLRVLGRADDVIVTGGYKVLPAVVEAAAREALDASNALDGWEVLVVGLPDPQWGETVALLFAPEPGTALGTVDPASRPDPAAVREALGEALRGALPRYAVPRLIAIRDALPLRGIGKPDRAEARRLLIAEAARLIE